jgi:hypothetical protein
MATNVVFTDAEFLSLPVPTGTEAGAPVRVGLLNAFTITAEGSVTETITLGAGTSITQPSGALSGNEPGFASCRLHGAAILPVTGVTAVGTPVYIKTADNTLQVTAAAGTKLYGVALRVKSAPLAGVLVKVLNGGIVADAA